MPLLAEPNQDLIGDDACTVEEEGSRRRQEGWPRVKTEGRSGDGNWGVLSARWCLHHETEGDPLGSEGSREEKPVKTRTFWNTLIQSPASGIGL